MKFEKQVSLKWAIALVLIACLVSSSVVYYVFAVSPSSTVTISGGVYPGAPSYTVWREGDYYFAKDANGEIEYSGTNASNVVQSCFDVIDSVGGGSVYFNPTGGEFVFTNSMLIPSNLLLDFGWSRIKMADNFNFYYFTDITPPAYAMMFTNKGFPYTPIVNVTIQNGIIDGNHDGQTTCGGIIAIKPAVKVTIRNLMIEHATYDAHDAIILALCNASLIDNVKTFDSGVVDGAPIGLRGCRQIVITNCHFENEFADGIVIYKEDQHVTADVYSWDIKIIGNTFIGAGRNAIRVETGCYDIVIDGNTIYDSGKNTIYTPICDHAAIFIYGLSNFVISNNVIRRVANNQTCGVYVSGVYQNIHNVLINNNIFGGQTYCQIHVDNVTDVEIADNDFYDTATVLEKGANVNNLIVRHNVGFVTENSGTATISASTTVTFNHGLAGTPTHVTCGFKAYGYGGWKWSANSTQITITVITTGTYTFSWYAEYKP